MSDNNRPPSDRRFSSFYGDPKSGNVTVEVRRKKQNLLDRKNALVHGDGSGQDAPRRPDSRPGRGAADISSRLSNSEFNARIEALKNAAPRQELPPRATRPVRAQTTSYSDESVSTAERPRNEDTFDAGRRYSHDYSERPPSSRSYSASGTSFRDRRDDPDRRSFSRDDRPTSSRGYGTRDSYRSYDSPRRDSGYGDRYRGDSPRNGDVPRTDAPPRSYDQRGYGRSSEQRGFPPRDGFRQSRYSSDFQRGHFRDAGQTDSPPPSGPIILRAASYGPSPQQGRDREKTPFRGDSSTLAKDGAPGFRSRRGPQASTYSDSLPIGAKSDRAPRVKKALGDSEPQDKKSARRSLTDSTKKLSRHVLTRAIDSDEDGRVRSVASYRRAQKKRFVQKVEPAKVSRDVVIPDTITVGDLSNRMAVSSAIVIKALMKLGTLASINQVIDGDTAELICVEFGHRPKRTSADDIEIGLKRGDSTPEELQSRPPVITVMGHVDHGKTSLLDALRKTNIIATEYGGITQKIGAYQIVTPYSAAKITFFDTPGHAAFSEMRARGANVTDIVVLVVAADDGINAQTLEAISHAKAANVPMIVAINKIDKPTADPQRAKNELLSHDVILEEFGGDVMAVEISAKVGTNLGKLVEAILLQAEVLELTASPEGQAEGVVVEASVQKGRGIVATVLVQKGTLRAGDIFVAGAEFGRVKIMYDYLGNKVTEAGPSCPVEVIGFSGAPLAGDDFVVVESEQRAREVADHRRQVRREKDALLKNKNSVEHMMTQIASGEGQTLNIVIKADTQGSLEAIRSNIQKLVVEGVTVQVVHGAIGDVNESDVALAKTSRACVVCFGVKATPQARQAADSDSISIGYYTVIYELLEQIEQMMKGQLAPTFEERVLGRAELRVVFTKGKVIKIAGCYVLNGLIRRSNSQVRVLRGEVVVFTGKIESMKHEQDDIKESKEGHECGIILDGFNDIEKGDIIECFDMVEVKAL